MKNIIYLDYNATTPLLPVVKDALRDHLDLIGNPSSIHKQGRKMRGLLEQAREQVANLVHSEATHITFTSGATEANNMAIFGAPVERILVSAIEHPSVLDAGKEKKAVLIPVDSNGIIDLAAFETMLTQQKIATLVSVMWVNNETGVIQPIAAIAALCKKHDALFHCDAVQAAGRLKINLQEIAIDYLSLSAHKIGGPAGIGALVYNHNTPLNKFIHGGGQERRRRAGTENILGAIAFGEAARYAARHIVQYNQLGRWRDALEQRMRQAVPDVLFAGGQVPRVGNTSQIILPGAAAETQLMALDLAGVAVSSGAACSSGSVKPSHVLLAMGVAPALASCAIRLSMGFTTTPDELERFFAAWVANSQRLRKS